ncbi:hypothetical protein F442_14963 [Phytophthora nicotianae P10297]|uniref:Uncharacterized protein n=3 Tax=Phytophthora nicotianae TaxID=4792 RepID=V9EME5_PHYNI|nr:hypothetical protein F443_15147 [Phytophthora nicotianae P1569]ETO68011.1 hypothetical protein F444_15124 [Phytophthora nicotianae P1976]ETP37219.1 hypothetical protein F442_14963 [Phytophthora nicotianae P10297]
MEEDFNRRFSPQFSQKSQRKRAPSCVICPSFGWCRNHPL